MNQFLSRLAWPICGLAVASGAVGLAFVSQGYSTGAPVGTSIGLSISMAAFGMVGALIASRQPRQPIGWLFLAVGLGANVAGVARAYGDYAMITRGSFISGAYAIWLGSWLFGVAIVLNLVVVFLACVSRRHVHLRSGGRAGQP